MNYVIKNNYKEALGEIEKCKDTTKKALLAKRRLQKAAFFFNPIYQDLKVVQDNRRRSAIAGTPLLPKSYMLLDSVPVHASRRNSASSPFKFLLQS